MKYMGDDVYLLETSGHKLYANCGIVGIGSKDDGGQGVAFEGYDGTLGNKADFSPEERAEIAAYAIALWQAWAAE